MHLDQDILDMCQAPVPEQAQSVCTRDRGHAGAHRCKAEDIDARRVVLRLRAARPPRHCTLEHPHCAG